MSLKFSAKHRFEEFEIDADFETEQGVTALFGRSGSGKTSILKMISGLITPQVGDITFNGDIIYSSKSGQSLAPHKRGFGYVFQEPRLFPHLNIRQNLKYGAWMQRKNVSHREFGRISELLGLSDLLDRQPHNLSGGEQQRVAIGRALLSSPRLLLMDEPLSSLDQARKAEILPFLEDLCANTKVPIVYVSHSVSEVMRLANQVILLEAGKVTSIQSPQMLNQNAAFVSSLARNELGAMIQGKVESFDPEEQLVTIALRQGSLTIPAEQATAGTKVKLFVAARDVMLGTQKPEGLSAMNILQGTVTSIDASTQSAVNVRLHCAGEEILAQITSSSAKRLQLQVGMNIYAIIKAVSFEPL